MPGTLPGMVKQALQTVETLVEEHRLVRRVMVIWVMVLITAVTVVLFFGDLSKITGAVAAAYASLTGILSVPLALYQWTRHRADYYSSSAYRWRYNVPMGGHDHLSEHDL